MSKSSRFSALENPLRFATRNSFAKLERIKNLGATLRSAAVGLRCDLRGAELELLDRLIELIPDDDFSLPDRCAALSRCLDLLVEIQSGQDGADNPSASTGALDSGASTMRSAETEPAVGAVEWPNDPQVALDTSVQWIKGIGPRASSLLAARGINTICDLLYFLPRRYQDRSKSERIADAEAGRGLVVEGEVIATSHAFIRGRRRFEVVLGDDSGHLRLMWFRVPGGRFVERFQKGHRIRAVGTISDYRGQKQIVHPEIVPIDGETERSDDEGIVPVYPEIEGIRPTTLRGAVGRILGCARRLPESLPRGIIDARALPGAGESFVALHRPPAGVSITALEEGNTRWHHRLIYEELLCLQLGVLRRRGKTRAERGYPFEIETSLLRVADTLFPFRLTEAQARVLEHIESDLSQTVPMHRLLQGDVGSGKTAVALTACAAAAASGVQSAIVAPTEILAEQHARSALKILPEAGVRVALLTGSMRAGEKRRTQAGIEDGSIDVVIGTHAVIQDGVRFRRLGLGIVDEQHRFGVMQRARLLEQGRAGLGANPHVLVMTATPIPRTLALTVYGDLDVSVIDELPPGRQPIETAVYRESQRRQVYSAVRQEVESGRQAYVVFPLVEESEKEGMDALRDATNAAAELASGFLQGVRIGLLHGRMSADEKDRVMRAFSDARLDVLVSTTVIEVGVDVPNATAMVIENAERFGLSQLHQLRGRVGRGKHASRCLLVTGRSGSEDAWRRLNVMVKTNDGFKIAEEDLEIRGPGDFMGTRQSGLPVLSFANLARDQHILEEARTDARRLLASDPELLSPENAALGRAFERDWRERLELASIG